MNRLALLVLAVLCLSMPLSAMEYVWNDTGQTVYGLRVVFSEPVEITGYGDVFMTVEPTGTSHEFIFTGAELEPWIGGQWFTWSPSTTERPSIEWLLQPHMFSSGTTVSALSADGDTSWEQMPYFYEWLADAPLSCRVNGVSGCENAIHMDEAGWRPKGLKILFGQTHLAIRQEIFDNRFHDQFTFFIGFATSSESITVRVNPARREADVLAAWVGGNTRLGAPDLRIEGGFFEVCVPYSMIATRTTSDELRSWKVWLDAQHWDGSTEETYSFAVVGRITYEMYEALGTVGSLPPLPAPTVEEADPLPDLVKEFTGELSSTDGSRSLQGTIRRYVSNERIPFYVRYELDFESIEDLDISWQVTKDNHTPVIQDAPLAADLDRHNHAAEYASTQAEFFRIPDADKDTARFVLMSNYPTYDFELHIQDADGVSYIWEDTEIDIPLHNLTPIALDATLFVPAEEIVEVVWSVENGDPDDAVTFPVANPASATTTLMSQWPNVLEVTVRIQRTDGTAEEYKTEALVYFREGTPFAVKSTATPIDLNYSMSDMEIALQEAFPALRRMGFNSMIVGVNWYHDLPDASGNYTIEPHPSPGSAGIATFPDQHLKRVFQAAEEEQLMVTVGIIPNPLLNVPPELGWGEALMTPGYLYGDGHGYENMLLYYIDLAVEAGVDRIIVGAERGDIEEHGGSATRTLFKSVMERYRAEGYGGEFSYAVCYWWNWPWSMQPFLLSHITAPETMGIPFEDMEYVGLTFYPRLATHTDPSTEEMYVEALRQVETYLIPLSQAYGKSVFIEDFYGFAYDGIGMNPTQEWGTGELDLEESRRWTTAWMRALSQANADTDDPLIAGITFALYALTPNRYMACFDPVLECMPYLNAGGHMPELQRLSMVYFRDVPTTDVMPWEADALIGRAIGPDEQEGIPPITGTEDTPESTESITSRMMADIPTGEKLEEVLGTLSHEELPVLLTWQTSEGCRFEEIDVVSGASARTTGPDPRFSNQGWRVSRLRGALLSQGLAISIEFAEDDHPSVDPLVEYVIHLGSSAYICMRSGRPVCGIERRDGQEVIMPLEYCMVDDDSIDMVFPLEYLSYVGIVPESLVGQKLALDVTYRGEGRDSHAFISYPGSAALERMASHLPFSIEGLEPSAGSTMIDDFEGTRSRIAGDYCCDSQENNNPGTDPTARCTSAIVDAPVEGKCLQFEYQCREWMLFGICWPGVVDLSTYDGVEITLRGDHPKELRVELAVGGPLPWQSFWLQGLQVEAAPVRFRLPFAMFTPAIPVEALTFTAVLRILPPPGAGTVYMDDLALYRDEQSGRPDQPMTESALRERDHVIYQVAEYLGNPFSDRYPDGSGWEHARAVWDMQVFNDQIYLAHGSIESNAGPIDVWRFDPSSERFMTDYTMDDEGIWEFVDGHDKLYIVGPDATESWDWGNVYAFDGSMWIKHRTLPHAIHAWSGMVHDGNLFVLGMQQLVDGTGKSYQDWELFVSGDGGAAWTTLVNDPEEATPQQRKHIGSLFEIGDTLYGYDPFERLVYECTSGGITPIAGVSLFPGDELEERSILMGHRVHFNGTAVYFGTVAMNPDRFPRTSLYVAPTIDGAVRSTLELQDDEEYLADIVVAYDMCWVMTNQLHADEVASTARLYVTQDLFGWELALTVETPTPIQSFEVHDGFLYFGLGPGHPQVFYSETGIGAGYAVGDNNPHSGEVFRLKLAGIPPYESPVAMALIPAGSFQMGDSFNEGNPDELPVHTVYVGAFLMDKYLVTKALWDEVAAWAEVNGYDIKPSGGSGKALDHPVYDITWHEAVKWCNARSERESIIPAYYTSSAQTSVYRTGRVDVQNDWVRWDTGYRLPTEAEWERAARGGCERRRFPWCDTDTIDQTRANYYFKKVMYYTVLQFDTSPTWGYHPTYETGSVPYTSPVGSFAPNGYGLYDMAGNVWEWCWDWYGEGYYAVSPVSNPRGPEVGSSRAIRGWAWHPTAGRWRLAERWDFMPTYQGNILGFRPVLPCDALER